QRVERQGTQGGEVLGGVGGADLAVVLGERHVAHPVQAGLDRPVPPHPAGQQRRVGVVGIQAGDGVDGLHAPAPVPVPSAADELEGLAGGGEELAAAVAAA